jgi:hypothetical protein
MTQTGLAKAIADARAHFANAPDDQIVLGLPVGTFDLTSDISGRGTIDVSNVRPGNGGRLILRGAGADKTVLIFSEDIPSIYGRDVSHVSFEGFHMTRKDYTVSQGHVVEVAPGIVTLDIQDGFPTPADIFDPNRNQGRYLRQCTDSANPQIVETDNRQLPWETATHVSGQRWKMNLTFPDIAPYPVGSLVAIKSKHGGDACWLARGSDIVFNGITWTKNTRCALRGISNVQILNSTIKKPAAINGQMACLASSEGGPQILGNRGEPPVTGNIVDNFQADGTGDDSIAFLNATGVVRNSRLSGSFARCILLYNSPTVELQNNQLVGCPLKYLNK